MNKDTERKLDELLAKMPKRNYDLDAWLSEDETAEFDRLQQTNTDFGLQQTNTDFDSQQTNTDLYLQRMNTVFHGSKRKVWRWVAAAACLLIIIGIGITMELMHQKPEDKPVIADNNAQPLPSLAKLPPSLAQPLPPSLAQLFPSLQGEGLGVGSETSKTLSVEKKLQTPPLTPPLEGRGAAAPTKTVVAPRKAIAQASQQDAIADTLGSGIWEHEENVVLAVQMLSECEQTIRREEQELRNNIIRATFNATPQPAKARLLLNDSGDMESWMSKAMNNIKHLSNSDWHRFFGLLTQKMIDRANKERMEDLVIAAGIILDLCKNVGQLDADEREVCARRLEDVSEHYFTGDKTQYIYDLLMLGAKKLVKKN